MNWPIETLGKVYAQYTYNPLGVERLTVLPNLSNHGKSNWTSWNLVQYQINVTQYFWNWKFTSITMWGWIKQREPLKVVFQISWKATTRVMLDTAPFQEKIVNWLLCSFVAGVEFTSTFLSYILFSFNLLIGFLLVTKSSFLALTVQSCGTSWCWSCWCWRYQIAPIFYLCGLGRTDEMNIMQVICMHSDLLWAGIPNTEAAQPQSLWKHQSIGIKSLRG